MPTPAGFTDLVGIGRIVGEVRKGLTWVIKQRSERRSRILKDDEQHLKNEQLKLRIQAQTIKNTAAKLQLIENYLKLARRYTINLNDLIQLIAALTPPKGAEAKSEMLPFSELEFEIFWIPGSRKNNITPKDDSKQSKNKTHDPPI